VVDTDSPTGYLNGRRELIVVARNGVSFDWIAQTQQMLVRGESRVRHVAYDNAPLGREVQAASPYRWWLGLLAWIEHKVSGQPLGLAVEWAVLWADPLLHGLFLIGGTLLVAWRFGGGAAAFVALGLVAFFPLASDFLPGAPDARGLAHGCVAAGLLFLLAGLWGLETGIGADTERRVRAVSSARRWFLFSGAVGGFGLWLNVSAQVLMVAGIGLGVLLAAWAKRRHGPPQMEGAAGSAPWRAWAAGGAAAVFSGYLAEYFPGNLGSWRLETVHPLYGLAWIGVGELLTRMARWIEQTKKSDGWREWLMLGLAVLAVALIPFVMWQTGSRGLLGQDPSWGRLSGLPDGVVAASFWGWLVRDGTTPTIWATVLPLLVLIPVGWLIAKRDTSLPVRKALLIALGPVLVILVFAGGQLCWWSLLDGALLVLLVVAVARPASGDTGRGGWAWSGMVAGLALVGGAQLLPPKSANLETSLTALESQALVERHLAQWLAARAGETNTVVFAPPFQTASICYYGGLRGIGTFATENRQGFGTSLMIAGGNTMESVQALIQARGVRFIVIPSWDPFFDEFAQRYLAKSFSNRTSLLVTELRRWNLPPWLRPIPYELPVSGGIAGQSALVFEVVEEQSPAVAASRLAEYCVESGLLAEAVKAAEALGRFPGDIGATVARIQVQFSQGDAAGANQSLQALLPRLSGGGDRFMPWDRRVSLAVVLARGQQMEQARKQTQRCVAEIDAEKLRSLSTGSLYGLMVLNRYFAITIADPKLQALALELLPRDLREAL
jgi:hypothetical protein